MFFISFFCLIVHFEDFFVDRNQKLVKNIDIKEGLKERSNRFCS